MSNVGPFGFIVHNRRFLSAGALLHFSSCPGQTFFISIFAAEIMADFALSDGEWGTSYTLATTASAAVLFWAGALTDRFRVRSLAMFVFPLLALTCAAMALNQSFLGLVIIVMFLRFFGQGMMFQLAATAMARWFVGRRGIALSISTLGFAVGQAFYPMIYASFLEHTPWRHLWLAAAASTLAICPIVLWLLARERTPTATIDTEESVGMDGRHWTRSEVLRSRFFWLLVPMLLGPPSWGTALFFQQVHIAEVKGWPLVEYLSLVPIMTTIAIVVSLTSGSFIDRFGSGRIMMVYLFPWIIAFTFLSMSETLVGALVAFCFFGVATGLQSTLITAFWAEYFGTRHIGAIKASSTSIMVFGSAVGPGITGKLIDFGYDFPSQMVAIAVYFVAATSMLWIALGLAGKRLA